MGESSSLEQVSLDLRGVQISKATMAITCALFVLPEALYLVPFSVLASCIAVCAGSSEDLVGGHRWSLQAGVIWLRASGSDLPDGQAEGPPAS
jgi:hypothetical protein